MSFPQALASSRGSWAGKSTLHLSWLPEDQRFHSCDSTLELGETAEGKFALITYTWTHERKPQAGTMIIGQNASGRLEAAWVDSWHQNSGILYSIGEAGDRATVTGHYDGGDGTMWGWRIELWATSQDKLHLEMTNITPDGEEEWAVRAEYSRS